MTASCVTQVQTPEAAALDVVWVWVSVVLSDTSPTGISLGSCEDDVAAMASVGV